MYRPRTGPVGISEEAAVALQSPRFAGDPVLEACLAGQHRMMAPEQGEAVRKVQQALIDLGFSIPGGPDGAFGGDTGEAVTQFKVGHDLFPSDPVVGVGTMTALDADITAFDGDTQQPVPTPAGVDPTVFLDAAVEAQRVGVSSENAVAEKLHGILSLMLFEQTSRQDKRRRG